MKNKNGVANHNIYINQGDDFVELLSLNGIDLTQGRMKFAGQYKLSDAELAFIGEATEEDGKLKLYISNKETEKLIGGEDHSNYGRCYYDVQLIVEDREQRILQGVAFISSGVAYKVGDKTEKPLEPPKETEEPIEKTKEDNGLFDVLKRHVDDFADGFALYMMDGDKVKRYISVDDDGDIVDKAIDAKVVWEGNFPNADTVDPKSNEYWNIKFDASSVKVLKVANPPNYVPFNTVKLDNIEVLIGPLDNLADPKGFYDENENIFYGASIEHLSKLRYLDVRGGEWDELGVNYEVLPPESTMHFAVPNIPYDYNRQLELFDIIDSYANIGDISVYISDDNFQCISSLESTGRVSSLLEKLHLYSEIPDWHTMVDSTEG